MRTQALTTLSVSSGIPVRWGHVPAAACSSRSSTCAEGKLQQHPQAEAARAAVKGRNRGKARCAALRCSCFSGSYVAGHPP